MSEYTVCDGRTLILRDPTLDDAQVLIDFLKVVLKGHELRLRKTRRQAVLHGA